MLTKAKIENEMLFIIAIKNFSIFIQTICFVMIKFYAFMCLFQINETVPWCVHWNFSTSSWSDNGCR